jgi:peptidyl-prolyl cis-trans isomerase SurA
MADPNIAAVIEPGEADYQRFVLSLLIKEVEYQLLSDAYNVAVTDREVQVRLDELLAADDPEEIDAIYARLAAEERVAEIDVRENVRQVLIREAVAVEEGLDAPVQESALRQRYEEIKDQLSTIELGVITVPDQETAEATLEALLADPSTYSALATTYAGPDTLPTLSTSAVSDVPAQLLPSVLQTTAGQGFTLAVPGINGIVVGYVAALDVPAFEDVQEQIRAEPAGGVEAATGELVTEFISGLDIDVNPRYGSLDQGQVVPDSEGGVVRILEDAGTA